MLPSCSTPTKPLFEVLVALNMLSRVSQHEPYVVSAMVARRKPLSVDACNLVLDGVVRIVDNSVNSGVRNIITWFEFVTYACHVPSLPWLI